LEATNDQNQPRKPCPICGKPSVKPFTPFCSKRCADLDLGRWLKGVYAIPVSDPEDAEPMPEDRNESD